MRVIAADIDRPADAGLARGLEEARLGHCVGVGDVVEIVGARRHVANIVAGGEDHRIEALELGRGIGVVDEVDAQEVQRAERRAGRRRITPGNRDVMPFGLQPERDMPADHAGAADHQNTHPNLPHERSADPMGAAAILQPAQNSAARNSGPVAVGISRDA